MLSNNSSTCQLVYLSTNQSTRLLVNSSTRQLINQLVYSSTRQLINQLVNLSTRLLVNLFTNQHLIGLQLADEVCHAIEAAFVANMADKRDVQRLAVYFL